MPNMNKRITRIFDLLLLSLLLSLSNCASQIEIIPEKIEPKSPLQKERPQPRFAIDACYLYRPLSIAVVGDIMLGHRAIPVLEKYGVEYPFERTSFLLRNADLALGNLEAPFTTAGNKFEKQYTFKVPPNFASGLKKAGIDGVSLANNHILDYGEEGLLSTIRVLEEVGIEYCGAGENVDQARKPVIFTVNGLKVAFFAFSMTLPQEFYATKDRCGTNYPYPAIMTADIRQWKKVVDYTVVSFHWGGELMEQPKEYQQYFAHLAIDSGADFVFGHHPHVLQGLELYKNRLIAYSLGNFSFGTGSSNAKESIILKIYLDRSGLVLARIYPISVYNAEVVFQPRLLTEKNAEEVFQKLSQLSRELNGGENIVDSQGMVVSTPGLAFMAKRENHELATISQ